MKKLLLIPFLFFLVFNSNAQSTNLEETGCNSVVFQNFGEVDEDYLVILEFEVSENVWIRHSKEITQDKRVFFDDLLSGNYRATSININQRESSNSINVQCRENSIDTHINPFKVFPNPAIESIELIVDFEFINDLDCHIYSMDGSLIREFKVHKKTSKVSVESMNEGLYMVALYDQNKMIGVTKLIIQKN